MKQEDIEHLGTLARIALQGEEKEVLAESITEILGYVSAVSEIASTEKEKKVGEVFNVLREDDVAHEPGVYTEALLNAAPVRKGQYVEVKKVLGGE